MTADNPKLGKHEGEPGGSEPLIAVIAAHQIDRTLYFNYILYYLEGVETVASFPTCPPEMGKRMANFRNDLYIIGDLGSMKPEEAEAIIRSNHPEAKVLQTAHLSFLDVINEVAVILRLNKRDV